MNYFVQTDGTDDMEDYLPKPKPQKSSVKVGIF